MKMFTLLWPLPSLPSLPPLNLPIVSVAYCHSCCRQLAVAPWLQVKLLCFNTNQCNDDAVVVGWLAGQCQGAEEGGEMVWLTLMTFITRTSRHRASSANFRKQ